MYPFVVSKNQTSSTQNTESVAPRTPLNQGTEGSKKIQGEGVRRDKQTSQVSLTKLNSVRISLVF